MKLYFTVFCGNRSFWQQMHKKVHCKHAIFSRCDLFSRKILEVCVLSRLCPGAVQLEPTDTHTKDSKMIRYGLLATGLALSVLPAATAQDGADFLGGSFSANVAVTTDYTFRGITQSSGDAAVQGGFDWASDLFYAGVWGSTVDFNDELVDPFTGVTVSDGASTEIDFYAGFTPSIGDVGLTFGAIYYFYPDAPQGGDDIFVPTGLDPVFRNSIAPAAAPGDLFIDSLEQNYVEVVAGASYAIGPIDAGLTLSWSPDYYFEAGDSLHMNLTAGVPLGSTTVGGRELSFSASGNLAYLEFFDDLDALDSFFEDYAEFGVGITATYWGIDFDARYIDTIGLAGNGNTGVFTVSKSF